MRRLVLLTDFGGNDWFVGVLKGVMATLAPKAAILDLSHDIPPGDIRAGAFNLWAAFRYFPKGSIFVAVVDPGVGGSRDPLLVTANGRFFLGPDNGLLSWATAGDPGRTIRILSNPKYRMPEVSGTFHGRDVFAPAAAHLSRGVKPAAFGKAKPALVELPEMAWTLQPEGLAGEVIHIDRFGNAITSIPGSDLGRIAQGAKAASIGRRNFPIKSFYAEVPEGQPLCLVGSTGLVELAINGGDAAKSFRIRRGDRVRIR